MTANEMKYTKYEITKIVGSRAKAISQGAPLLIEFTKEELAEMNYNPVRIAKKEFEKGVLPITVERVVPPRKEDAE